MSKIEKKADENYFKLVDFLTDKVSDQHIFPYYFMHVCNTSNNESINLTNATNTSLQKDLDCMITAYYKKRLGELETKTNLIASWNDFKKFAFLQYVASEPEIFELLDAVQIDKYNELKQNVIDGTITKIDASSECGFDNDKIEAYREIEANEANNEISNELIGD